MNKPGGNSIASARQAADRHPETRRRFANAQAPMRRVCHGDPAVFHLALAVDDLDDAKSKVWGAGGTFVEEVRAESGSVLLMMRDPWGIALQLCHRIPPLVGGHG